MSAVSRNVTPRSRARWMVAIDSSQSVAPYHSLIPMQPRPCADTVSWPRLVVRMCVPYSLSDGRCVGRFGHPSLVAADLRVEQLQRFPLPGQGPPHLPAVPLEQFEALGVADAR